MKYVPKSVIPDTRSIEIFDNVTPLDGDENVSIYKTLVDNSDNEYISPVAVKVYPTQKDFERGFFTRYFIRQRNYIYAPILEISENQYKKYILPDSGIDKIFYIAAEIKWYLTGNQYNSNSGTTEPGVYESNKAMVKSLQKIFPTIDTKITNYLEFFRTSA